MRSLSTAVISPDARLALVSCDRGASQRVAQQPAADTSATVYLEIGQ